MIPDSCTIGGPKRPLEILTALLRNGRLPHAFLFTGISGTGKAEMAERLAMALNCTGASGTDDTAPMTPCGTCRACHKIASGTHPDILRIGPSKAAIKVDQIRSLRDALAMKPFEARHRVVIVSPADTMNPSAANALLKALEEPPAGTVFVLIAEGSADLLPTIVSRCQRIRFDPLGSDILAALLGKKHGLDAAEAAMFARMAGGSRTRAETMADPEWRRFRKWWLTELADLENRDIGRLLSLAAAVSADKDRLDAAFALATGWYRDVMVLPHCPERILNTDLTGRVQCVSQHTDSVAAAVRIRWITRSRAELAANGQPRLIIESLLFRLAGIAD